jgi:phytoene synthase
LPCDLFDDCIDACATDAGPVRMEDWEDLHNYCHGVAGTVGEACLRILGYGQSSEALRLSEINGRAVQLTNILRDVDEDLGLDRVYLPQTLLANFGVESEDFSLPERPPRLRDALLHASTLAVADFQAAEPMFEHLRPADRAPIVALTLRYRHLLGRLQADRFGTHGRMALGTGAKLKVLMAAKLSRWKTTWRE